MSHAQSSEKGEVELAMTAKERKAESGKRIYAALLENETPEQKRARLSKKKNQSDDRKAARTNAQIEQQKITEHDARELKKTKTSESEKRALKDNANARGKAINDALSTEDLVAKRKRLSTGLAERRRKAKEKADADAILDAALESSDSIEY